MSLSEFDSRSHWSTMVYTRSENKYLYFDSSSSYNKVSALRVAKKIILLFKQEYASSL